jgi:hypothetical protein
LSESPKNYENRCGVWLKAKKKERRSHKRFIAFIWFLNALLFNEKKSFFYDPEKPCIICWSRNVTQNSTTTEKKDHQKMIRARTTYNNLLHLACPPTANLMLLNCMFIISFIIINISSQRRVFSSILSSLFVIQPKTQHHQCFTAPFQFKVFRDSPRDNVI